MKVKCKPSYALPKGLVLKAEPPPVGDTRKGQSMKAKRQTTSKAEGTPAKCAPVEVIFTLTGHNSKDLTRAELVRAKQRGMDGIEGIHWRENFGPITFKGNRREMTPAEKVEPRLRKDPATIAADEIRSAEFRGYEKGKAEIRRVYETYERDILGGVRRGAARGAGAAKDWEPACKAGAEVEREALKDSKGKRPKAARGKALAAVLAVYRETHDFSPTSKTAKTQYAAWREQNH